MSKQVLQMKYHPAKKEVEFKRFQSGKETKIKKNSKLMEYMNKKGTFVLQNYGHKFFDDIAKAFDGEEYIDIKVITTKIDYDDFCQMVEKYNEQSTCKFNPILVAELPDMNQTCQEVKKYGEQAIAILESHRDELFDKILFENDEIKKNLSKFDEEIVTQIKNIRSKINSLNDSRVNLCFTGVYSSGKSSLINALLGYKVLPENITSETAKMITIYSPQLGENVKIKFKILDVPSEIEWDENEYCFHFIKGPSENSIRREIQNKLNQLKDKGSKIKQHEQINSILGELNKMNKVSSGIELIFPISLDNEIVQFKIFDTPGTDSNNESHNYRLKNALKNQTHSILIFVAKPDGLEGMGNNILLDYLKEVDQNSSKTSIDIGRSLFIFNKADTIQAPMRIKLQDQNLNHKGDVTFSIELNDKKLFFTSAQYAYVAKAKQNDILSSNEETALYNLANVVMTNDLIGNCYKQNRCGESELGTNQLIEKCDKALEEAKQKGNDTDIILISSGLYALESEIVQYAEKFSPSVRAFAIINSMDKAIQKLTDEAESSIKRNQEAIDRINSDIKNLKEIVSNKINDKAEEMKIRCSDDKKMKEVSNELGVNSKRFKEDVVYKVMDSLDKKLHSLYVDFFKKVDDNTKINTIKDEVNKAIDEFNEELKNRRKKLLEENQREFIKEIKKIISENGDISENTKKDILKIPELRIKVGVNTKWDQLYKSHIKTNQIFIFKTINLNKEDLLKEVEIKLTQHGENFIKDFLNDYNDTLKGLINGIRENYMRIFNDYSKDLREMNNIREEMLKLGKEIEKAANDLNDCKGKINAIIWGDNNNVRY